METDNLTKNASLNPQMAVGFLGRELAWQKEGYEDHKTDMCSQ